MPRRQLSMKRVVGFSSRKNFLYNFSKSMNFAYFPLREFTEALAVTSKVKSRLQPFIEEVENYNMEWVFQMLMELYTYTVSAECELNFKFNSLVALKILLDTCELPVVMMIEVYFLPHVRRVATYQLQASQKHRGLDYFLSLGYKGPEVKKLGYNYVRLASEIVAMMASVKPYRLYRDEELAEASQFVNVLEIMRAQQWREYDMFAFYQVEESAMRELFLRKLKCFARYTERYYDFFDTYLDKFIRKEYSPKVLDPRKILQAGEVFACNHVLQELIGLLSENKASIKTNVLRLFTDFVRWGYIRAAYHIECSGIFDQLLQQAKVTKGGKGSFRSIGGSDEQRRNLYCELIRSLQIWAICIPKSPMNLVQQSRSSLIYKQFLKKHVQVPFSGNMKKIRDECQDNLQKNQLINLLTMKELKKNDFDASKMRRTSSNLEELINLDKNMGNSMAALIMEAKFLNDLSKQELNSTSSLSISTANQNTNNGLVCQNFNKNITLDLEPLSDPTSQKQNKQPRSKQPFNKHKTVSLNNLLSKAETKTKIVDEFSCLQECPSDQQNFSDECDQKFRINELRSIDNKNSFSSMKVAKKMLESFQLDTVKLAKQQKQGSMIQFFQETIRTPTNSINQSNWVVQVIKPSPYKESPKKQHVSTPLKSHKEKATIIPFQQRLGFPTRRNEYTVAPEMPKGQKIVRWNDFLPDEQCSSPNNNYYCINQARFVPFLKECSEMQGKKALLRNKDILLKTSKIQIGFIFQMRTHQASLLTIFITPHEHLSNLKWEVICPPTVSCSEKGEKLSYIQKHKQRRLMFYFWVKPPYSLPTLTLNYEMQGKQQRHNLALPISFNKFVKYLPQNISYDAPINFRTSIQKFNTKDFQTSQLPSLFPDFTVKKQEDTMELAGGVQYEEKSFNLSLKIRQESHIQISCQLQQCEVMETEAVQFLMAVLLFALKK